MVIGARVLTIRGPVADIPGAVRLERRKTRTGTGSAASRSAGPRSRATISGPASMRCGPST